MQVKKCASNLITFIWECPNLLGEKALSYAHIPENNTFGFALKWLW